MLKKLLGKTGMLVSQLGYGSMGLRGPRTWGVRSVDEPASERMLHAVLDAGINFIDTSPDYGICEERIGRYLSSRRSEFYLATKCGCSHVQHGNHLEIRHTWTKATIQRNIEESLVRLQTNHIDLLQFHGGEAKVLHEAGLIDVVKNYQAQGVIRSIGVSTSLPNLPAFLDLNVFDTFQIPYSCIAPEHEPWLARVATTGAGIIIRGATAQGGPEAVVRRPTINQIWELARLSDLLPEGMKPAELILRYTLTHPDCHTAIVGTCNEQHLLDNVAAANTGPLPELLYDEITRQITSAIESATVASSRIDI